MKLNWAERWVVNNPSRVFQQRLEIDWMSRSWPLEGGSTVLEIGCGRGAGARLILKAFRPGLYHAMDLDLEMIRRARRYLSPEERRRVSLYVGDVLALPYRDDSLDAVFAFGVLHHVPDWRTALHEISRVLKPGGAYFLEEIYPFVYQNFITRHILLHPKEDRFFSGDLHEALEECRFEVKAARELKLAGMLGI
ncbi:MAG TPA: class I SAM-dependent methyltransferase, partial [Syntrophobacteraceae bacterium]|nr:class I SAM-dependent methyltransferase [Syntrophobacteraceae bacterium]